MPDCLLCSALLSACLSDQANDVLEELRLTFQELGSLPSQLTPFTELCYGGEAAFWLGTCHSIDRALTDTYLKLCIFFFTCLLLLLQSSLLLYATCQESSLLKVINYKVNHCTTIINEPIKLIKKMYS